MVTRLWCTGLATLVLVTGCSAPSPGPPSEDALTTDTGASSTGSSLSGLSVVESGKARAEAARAAQLQHLECLESKGFPGTMQGDGTFRVDVTPEQRDVYQAAWNECYQEADLGVAEAMLTQAEIEWLYKENVAAYECLKNSGFEPIEPVSLEVYAHALNNPEEGAPWSPFESDDYPGGLPRSTCPEPDLYEFAETP